MKLGGAGIYKAIHRCVWNAYQGEMPLGAWDLKINPNSVDVTLHQRLMIPAKANSRDMNVYGFEQFVDPFDQCAIDWYPYDMTVSGPFLFRPGRFALASVRERFDCSAPLDIVTATGEVCLGEVPNITRKARFAPMYEGRSTMGRLGIDTHSTAGFGDHGFQGAFTLELYNKFPFPILLRHGMRIGQVAFDEVSDPGMSYKGAYAGAEHHDGPRPPVLGKDRF